MSEPQRRNEHCKGLLGTAPGSMEVTRITAKRSVDTSP